MKKILSLIDRILFDHISPGQFRFMLAFLVVIYHSVDFITLGHYAVYVFFMLSGYWIFKMYNEKYLQYKNSYLVYISSRLARLMPLYWIVLLFSVLIYATVPAVGQRLAHAEGQGLNIGLFNFWVIGLANSFHQFIGTAWSLDIEIQFYIVAPLLLFVLKKGFGLPLLILSSIIALFLVYNQIEFESLLLYLPYFLIGGFIYHFNIEFSKRLSSVTLLILVSILLLNYFIPELRTGYLLDRKAYVFGFNYREGLNVIFSLLTIPFISINVRKPVPREDGRKDQLWSSMSYVIYLLHWPLLLIYSVCIRDVSGQQKAIYLAVLYILCIVLSYLIAKYVDTGFEKWRRNLLSKVSRKQMMQVSNANL